MRDAKAFSDIVVANRGNLVIRLGDVGDLVEREREPDSLARVDGVPPPSKSSSGPSPAAARAARQASRRSAAL